MATKNIPNEQGRLPGRQTEVPNAGDGFPAKHDLKRAKDVPESVRDRVQEVDLKGEPRGLHDAGDLRGPRGENQQSRGRSSNQD